MVNQPDGTSTPGKIPMDTNFSGEEVLGLWSGVFGAMKKNPKT
jgi:hypothetical protein